MIYNTTVISRIGLSYDTNMQTQGSHRRACLTKICATGYGMMIGYAPPPAPRQVRNGKMRNSRTSLVGTDTRYELTEVPDVECS